MAEKSKLALSICFLTISLTACGPRRLALPSGAGTPSADYASIYTAARSFCESVTTLQAELSLSGRAAGQRVRGRVLGGFVPAALRLEGIAPFGTPVFILVADGPRGTLLLSRDRRVVRDAAPEEILNALIGLRLGPDDLRALLSGCVKAGAEPAAGRRFGNDWIAVDLKTGGTLYLRRNDGQDWRIAAGRYGGLEIDYLEFDGPRPSRISLSGSGLNLGVSLSQVEIGGNLPRNELVTLKVPEGVTPLTLEELRRAGPLGQ